MWFTPAFASLLEKRGETFALVGAGAAHLTLSLAGLLAWSCPIRAATGIPCPGCGQVPLCAIRSNNRTVLWNGDVGFLTFAIGP